MKFTDGFWRDREGLQVSNAFKVRDIALDGQSITAWAPCNDVRFRGDTLTGPLLTIKLTSPMPEVIRVQVLHYTGANDLGPSYQVQADRSVDVKTGQKDDKAFLQSGNLSVQLEMKDTWNMEFLSSGKALVNSRHKNLGYVKTPDKGAFMKEQLSLSVGELVYGFGEKFTSFVKNGQIVDTWNADGGTSSELAYKTVPFYMTNKGYGVFVNNPGDVSFEVASEKVSRVQFSVPGESLDYYIINGPEPKQILKRYAALTGQVALPPAWSFGLWLTTSFVTDYDEATVSEFVDGMASRNLPLNVFHFDCFWMKEYHWTNFVWDEKQFPDPQGFLNRLKARGLKICVWINSYIAQRSQLFDEGKEKGYLLKRKDGSVYQTDTWQAGMGFVDFTNPEACKWFASYLEKLVAMGVDSFKTDFGERIPTEDVAWFDGSDPVKMHNYYSFIYNKTVFETLERLQGKGKSLVFARSGTAGSQQFPVHWGGDCTASFESMAESLRGGLSLGVCGFGFWSHDISGFEMTATAALYKRWTAFGLFSSHSRLHGNASYRVPWLFDEEAVDVLRFFTNLKCTLMPYIWQAAIAAKDGLPVMRAMMLEFPDDPAAAYLDKQYMFGPDILVAPVFSADEAQAFYLPEGRWTNLLTNEIKEGGRWLEELHDFMSLPLYARPGSLIAYGTNSTQTEYDFAMNAELRLFELAENQSAECKIFNADAELDLCIIVKRTGNELQIEIVKSGKPWKLRLVNLQAASADSGKISVEGKDSLIAFDGKEKTSKVRI